MSATQMASAVIVSLLVTPALLTVGVCMLVELFKDQAR